MEKSIESEKLLYFVFGVNIASLWKYLFFTPISIFSYPAPVYLSAIAEILCPLVFLFFVLIVRFKKYTYMALSIFVIGILEHIWVMSYGVYSVSIPIIMFLCIMNILVLIIYKERNVSFNKRSIYLIGNFFFATSIFWFLILVKDAYTNGRFYYWIISVILIGVFFFKANFDITIKKSTKPVSSGDR